MAGLEAADDPAPAASPIPARIFKVNSLANGSVSVVFHFDNAQSAAALGLHHLRGKAITVDVQPPREN